AQYELGVCSSAAERLEFAASESPDGRGAFAFLTWLAANPSLASLPTAAVHEHVLASSRESDAATTALLRLSLAAHVSAPKVESLLHLHNQEFARLGPECPASWIAFAGKGYCDARLFQGAVKRLEDGTDGSATETVYPFDHIYFKSASAPVAILYADVLDHASFAPLHASLNKLADAEKIQYVLRYKPSPRLADSRHYLSGFGVELDIKSSDYMVIDDRNLGDTTLKSQDSSEDASLEAGEKPEQLFLFDEESSEIKSLSKDEIRDLAIKMAQVVLSSASPVDALLQLTQDFPKYSHLIAKTKLSSAIRVNLRSNQMSLASGGKNYFFLNGINLKAEQLNVFSVVNAMRSERKLVQSLQGLNLSVDEAVRILSLPTGESAESSNDLGWGDAFDVRDESVVWWNDLEKDKRYKQFPGSLHELLRPGYPGQLKYIRKNLFNVLFVLDLTNYEHLNVVLDIFKFVEHSVPLRMGLVPLVNEADGGASLLAARSFMHIIKTHGRKECRDFILQVHAGMHENISAATKKTVPQIVESAFENSAAGGFKALMAGDADKADVETNARFLNRVGVSGGSGAIFLNGKFIDVDDNWQQSMLGPYPKMLEFLQMRVYEGALREKDDIYEYFMKQPNVHPRRNPYIFASDDQPLTFVNLFAVDKEVLQGFEYVSQREDPAISIQIIADFDTQPGLALTRSALEYASASPNARIAFIHNPPADRVAVLSTRVLLHKAAALLVHKLGASRGLQALLEALQTLEGGATDFAGASVGDERAFVSVDEWSAEFERWALRTQEFAQSVIGVSAGGAAVVVNGRVVGPFSHPERFTELDFELLAANEYRDRVSKVDDALSSMALEGVEDKAKWIPDAMMKMCSLISYFKNMKGDGLEEAGVSERSQVTWSENSLAFSVGDEKASPLRFTVILDPLSVVAQKASFFIKTLSKVPGVSIKVLLNPLPVLEELPVKRFYRYVFEESMTFDTDGNPIPPVAQFKNIPTEPLLTLGLDVPRAWVIRPIESIHDLDNIKLSNVKSASVDAHFQLRNILVEGHAREHLKQTPPRGVQFILGTPETSHLVDTITMTNLGYLQLKANPGVWTMQLREGRSRDVYTIDSVSESYFAKNGDKVGAEGAATVIVNTFEGVTIFPILSKRPGMEKEDVLEPDTAVTEAAKKKDDGVWNQFKSRLFGKDKASTALSPSTSNATINIFSIASGHLYERFMGIMMVSVVRNTKSPVKFWLIENFLSPKFMSFVPHLAKEYNFDYEFVTYNWPHWLRATTRKERTIWAYKILFLDVIFPLNLDKVIFVDADQVVRVDMQELVDLDLQGAVYGYTPMGDSRPEMEGFRFWKGGYWENHLKGKPYHISALYVIDLKRFRQLLAGDRLRQQYQMLSADPNSLSNLDQDLPNNMIHDIPIFSLPKEWLWCETWCADEELKNAKTIDLCNNPLTKEPKLKRAKRIIKEWEELDNLVKAVADKVEKAEATAANTEATEKNGHSEL
ncbi:UDP-glucose:glycoprotein glucosyltransferase-domain-containing protein, partial [Chytriomyces sp. MP71]